MVTASRTFSPLRARMQQAGPVRVFWLATLILGLLYTHGVSAESAAHHAAPGLSTTAMASTAPDDHTLAPAGHEDGSAEHAAEDCLSGQPQQGVDLPEPCSTALVTPRLTPVRFLVNSRPADADTSSAMGRDPAILQV
ncbi:hypothetical protein [Streptomyces boluensis]|uniref:Uncharacterized protein n=1 Tax=Streptomyces boluensis TaxID=1775135 RepID=A0A964UK60_9ACTN|nr:hypothetical protein [Streptomyces boluensis]NBE50127.1 hypothetical protein [Streptomyces boluensis]